MYPTQAEEKHFDTNAHTLYGKIHTISYIHEERLRHDHQFLEIATCERRIIITNRATAI
jgi:hypothetical protein